MSFFSFFNSFPKHTESKGNRNVQALQIKNEIKFSLHINPTRYSHQLDPMTRSCWEYPDAILLGRIRIRKVRTRDFSGRVRDLVLAAALLAVVIVLVQHETWNKFLKFLVCCKKIWKHTKLKLHSKYSWCCLIPLLIMLPFDQRDQIELDWPNHK